MTEHICMGCGGKHRGDCPRVARDRKRTERELKDRSKRVEQARRQQRKGR